MSLLLQRINKHPLYSRIFEWFKLLTFTGGAQIAVQLLALVSSIIIIRLLTPAEYALYTLANTMVATMTLLADGGISAGVLAQGARVWQDREKLGAIFNTGFSVRKKFAIGSLLFAMPILIYLLIHHGASWIMAIVISLALVPAFITSLSNQLLVIIPKLNQDIYPLQKIELGVNLWRLLLLLATIFLFPLAFVAILAAGIPQIWGNKKFYALSSKYADLKQETDKAVEKEIYRFIKRMMPGVIYYCLAGNLMIWIASIVGSTNVVAQIGALGRLALILTVCNMVFNTLITPRFAKLVGSARILLRRYIQINIGLVLFSLVIVIACWLLSDVILWVLGPDYANLNKEVVLVVIGSCISFVAVSSYSLNTGRGWVIHPAVSIPIEFSSVVVGLLLIDVSTLSGILYVNIFIASVHALMHVGFSLIKINKVKTIEIDTP